MRLLKLSICAFGPYKKEQVIDFNQINDRKLFLITGPTGAGKTSIFDAISYALYGQASGNSRDGDSFRSDFSSLEDETYVSLSFQIKDVNYFVRRSPKQERKKLKGDGTTTKSVEAILEIENGKTYTGVVDVTNKIQEILGINYHQFKQIVMLPQGEFRQLLEANSKDREEIFRKIFRTEDYLAIQEVLKAKTSSLKKSIGDVYNLLNNHIEHIMYHEDSDLEKLVLAEYKDIDQVIDLLNEKIEEDQIVLDKIQETIEIKEKEIFNLEKEINDAKNINQKFHRKDELLKQKKLMIEQEKEIKQLEEILKKAKLASIIYQIEQQINNIKSSLEENKEKQIETTDKQHELKKLFNEITIDLHKKEDELKKIKPISDTTYALQEKLKKYSVYEEKITQLKTSEEKKKEIKEVINKKNEETISIKAEIDQLDNLFNSYKEIKDQNSLQRMNKEKIEHQLKDHQLILTVLKDIHMLKKEHHKFSENYQKMKKDYNRDEIEYNEKVELYRMGQAGILAQTLKPNKPCPVCGSKVHPNKAELFDDVLDVETLDELKSILNEKENLVNECYANVLSVHQRIVDKKNLYDQLSDEKRETLDTDVLIKERKLHIEQLEDQLLIINKKIYELEENMKDESASEKRLLIKKEELKDNEEALIKLNERYHEINNKHQVQLESIKEYEDHIKDYPNKEELENEIEKLNKRINEINQNYQDVSQKKQVIEKELLVLKTNITHLKERGQRDLELLEKEQKKFDQKLNEASFRNEEEYRKYLYEEKKLNEFDNQIREYYEEMRYIDKTLMDFENQLKDKKIRDINSIMEKQDKIKQETNDIRQSERDVHLIIQNNQKLKSEIHRLYKKVKTQLDEYEILSDLSKAANGDNPQKLTFERYVLAAYFDEIINAANLRLSDMTNRRYYLCRKEEKGKGASQQGLELEVVDNYTSKNRLVKTLSGGEAFMASLALALGLADVIQSYSGGIELDTIFIDEGFGSLDPDSLDHAITTLTNIQKSGRLVGIISHVQELKDRVDVKLEIIPSHEGSRARFIY